MTLSLSSAQLIALFLESTFWGIHVITYFSCISTLFFEEEGLLKPANRRRHIAVVGTILLGLGTLSQALIVYHTYSAFVTHAGSPGGAEARFKKPPEWLNSLRTVLLLVTTMLGDAIMIWRCWIVYYRSFLAVALPSLLWLACIGMAVGGVGTALTKEDSAVTLISAPALRPFITAFWVFTFTLNLITTAQIVYRLLSVERQNRESRVTTGLGTRSGQSMERANSQWTGQRHSKIMDAACTIIESGTVFLVGTFLCLVVFVTVPNGLYPVSDVLQQLAGTAFNMIVIRSASRDRHARLVQDVSNRSISFRDLDSVSLGVMSSGGETDTVNNSMAVGSTNGHRRSESVRQQQGKPTSLEFMNAKRTDTQR